MPRRLSAEELRKKYSKKKMSKEYSFPYLKEPVRTEEDRERLVKFAQEVASMEWVEKKPVRKPEKNDNNNTEDRMARRKNNIQEETEVKENPMAETVQETSSEPVAETVQETSSEPVAEAVENNTAEETVESNVGETDMTGEEEILKNMTDLVKDEENGKDNRLDEGTAVGDAAAHACGGGNPVADSDTDTVGGGKTDNKAVQEEKPKPKKRRMTYEEMWSGYYTI